MCRHLAYLGPPASLRSLLIDPPHSLYRQAWAPRLQRHGTVNADGFGVGWYAEGDPVPARYRRTGPIWGDPSFADLARVTGTRALLAAVRDATVAGADGEAAAAPFAAGPWLFSHNGAVRGWPGTLAPLVSGLPPAESLSLEARCDSAFVWALLLHRLRSGDEEGQAMADTVVEVAEAAPGSRLTLWYLIEPGRRTLVASEPHDDDPLWREVPDRTLLTANRTDVLLTPLKDMSEDTAPAQRKEPRT
jgi:glutamine amidotransferase